MAIGAILGTRTYAEADPGDSSSPMASLCPLPERAEGDETIDFADLYEDWFSHVCRWLRAFGIPHSDREDVAQEVFLVAERRLATFDGRNVPAWLYSIARNTASDQRRRAWFRNLLTRRKDLAWDTLRDPDATPEEQAEQRSTLHAVSELLAKLPEERRHAFILFEIEGYSGEEIALLERIPVATVWTRLHYARKQFGELAKERLAHEVTP